MGLGNGGGGQGAALGMEPAAARSQVEAASRVGGAGASSLLHLNKRV